MRGVRRLPLTLVLMVLAACDGPPRGPLPGPRGDGGPAADARTSTPTRDAGGLGRDAAPDVGPGDAATGDAATGDGSSAGDAAQDPCAGVTCSGRGRCAVAGREALCVCDAGFVADGLSCVPPPMRAPVVDAIRVSPTTARVRDTVSIEVDVRDPDGAGDVASGAIEGTSEAFTAVRPGLWRWSGRVQTLLAATPTNLGQRGPLPIGVEFFDRGGAVGRGRAELTVECEPASGVCGGTECESLDFAPNCGGCGLSCPAQYACSMGPNCLASPSATPGVQTCDQACPAGGRCVSSEYFLRTYQPIACNQRAPTMVTVSFEVVGVECSCLGGFNATPQAGETCTAACNRFSPPGCRSTLLRVREAGGAPMPEGDTCAPPYRRPVSGALQVGQTYATTYNTTNHTCRCEATAR